MYLSSNNQVYVSVLFFHYFNIWSQKICADQPPGVPIFRQHWYCQKISLILFFCFLVDIEDILGKFHKSHPLHRDITCQMFRLTSPLLMCLWNGSHFTVVGGSVLVMWCDTVTRFLANDDVAFRRKLHCHWLTDLCHVERQSPGSLFAKQ